MARGFEDELARLVRKVRARAASRYPDNPGGSAPPGPSPGGRLARAWSAGRARLLEWLRSRGW